MRKLFTFLIVLCIFVGNGSFAINVFAEDESTTHLNDESMQQPLLNDRVVNVLKQNNIDFQIEDGYIIKLNKISSEHIAYVNQLLAESMDSVVQENVGTAAAAKYPTAWVYMKQYDRTTSKKFTKATKTAFVAAVGTWLGGITGGATTLAKAAGGAFGGYYFVESDVQNVFAFMKYSYRELGPGKVGPTGSFMGDYEIKKVERITKSSNGSGGQVNTRYKKSTIVEPYF